MKHIIIFLFLAFVLSCVKTGKVTNVNAELDVSAEEIDESELKISEELLKQQDKVSDEKYNANSSLSIQSVAIVTSGGEKWFIGKLADTDTIGKTNTVIYTEIFGINFGPIDGYENEEIKVGWNKQNRILYIEVLSPNVKTYDGLSIGDSKSDIVKRLGIPRLEYTDRFRYDNLEFEVVGIMFQFKENVISRIFMYSYT